MEPFDRADPVERTCGFEKIRDLKIFPKILSTHTEWLDALEPADEYPDSLELDLMRWDRFLLASTSFCLRSFSLWYAVGSNRGELLRRWDRLLLVDRLLPALEYPESKDVRDTCE